MLASVRVKVLEASKAAGRQILGDDGTMEPAVTAVLLVTASAKKSRSWSRP